MWFGVIHFVGFWQSAPHGKNHILGFSCRQPTIFFVNRKPFGFTFAFVKIRNSAVAPKNQSATLKDIWCFISASSGLRELTAYGSPKSYVPKLYLNSYFMKKDILDLAPQARKIQFTLIKMRLLHYFSVIRGLRVPTTSFLRRKLHKFSEFHVFA